MKHLYLGRHAKSDWSHVGLDDFDRPLNKRGRVDASTMGQYLAARNMFPNMIVTSPARRALATAASLAAAIQVPPSRMVEDERIYAASTSTLIAIMQAWNETWERVMMVGHNPGIADMAAVLTGAVADHVPTCTVMELRLDVTRWRDVQPGCGTLRLSISPKAIHNVIG